MRHGRAKQARRTLQFFQRTTGIRTPYNVLVDGTFTVAMLQSKLPLQERLERLLQHGSTYQLFMTQSSLDELDMLAHHAKKKAGKANDENIFEQARKWAQENCKILVDMPQAPEQLGPIKDRFHEQQQSNFEGQRKRKRKQQKQGQLELTVAQNDILRLVTDAILAPIAGFDKGSNEAEGEEKKKTVPKKPVYFVATQDETVLGVLRNVTVPLIRLARGSILLLEQPSKRIQSQDKRIEEQKWSATAGSSATIMTRQEQELVQEVKAHENEEQQKAQADKESRLLLLEPGRRKAAKKHKAKGPNPLSCKKKTSDDKDAGSKRRRKRPKTLAEPEA